MQQEVLCPPLTRSVIHIKPYTSVRYADTAARDRCDEPEPVTTSQPAQVGRARERPELDAVGLSDSWLQAGRKVAEEGGLMNDIVAADFFAAAPDIQDYFDDIFDVALGVDAARNGEAH
jgi:hypothetical protein